MVETAKIIWADGPSSDPIEPSKPQIRAWGTWLENLTASLGMAVTATYIRGTKAQLDAVSGSTVGQVGIVVADDNEALRGIYVREGSTWVRKLDLPADAASAAAIIAVNARDIAVDAKDIALAAEEGAKVARDIAAGYASDAVSQGNVPIYATIAGVAAINVPVGINAIRVNGAASAGDGNGGLFVDANNGSTETFTSADGRTWYRAADVSLSRLDKALAVGQYGRFGDFELSKNFASNDNNANDLTISILFPRPETDCRGVQSACWVAERGNWYIAWKITGDPPIEQIRLSRHDRTGALIDFTATIDYLGHGQELDYVYNGGVFTLIAQTGDRRGMSAFEYVPGTPSTITNLRQYTLDDAGVTSGGMALSLDKKSIIHSFSPYYDEGAGRSGKGWKIFDLAAILAGPTGNRIDEPGSLLWHGRQFTPQGVPEQGFAFDGVNIYQINSAGTILDPAPYISCTRVLDSKLLWTQACTPRLHVTGETAITAYELEGLQFVVPGPGMTPQLWVGFGIGDGGISTRRNMVAPLMFGEIGAVSVNGNRAPFGIAQFFAGGTYKEAWFGSEAFRRGVWRASPIPGSGEPHAGGYVEGVTIEKAYAGDDYYLAGLSTDNTELPILQQDRSNGNVSMVGLTTTSCKATILGDQTILGSSARTKVNFNSPVFANGKFGNSNAITVNGDGTVTVAKAGSYRVRARICLASGVTVGETLGAYIIRNTADVALEEKIATRTTNDWLVIDDVIVCQAGDVIKLEAYGSNAASKIISSSTARTTLNIQRV